MIEYVAGFCFFKDEVVLIQKQNPEWQKGKWNGVGGKIEASDSTIHFAMSREFQEETAITNYPSEWKHFLTLEKMNDWRVYFFKWDCCCKWNINPPADPKSIKFTPKATTGEIPKYQKVSDVVSGNLPVIDNLRWIIPLALQSDYLHLPVEIFEK